MGRPAGRRNRDYAETRHALATRAAPHLLDDSGEPATLTSLASATGVSPTTLRHYFGDREGVYRAAMEAVRIESRRHLEAMQRPGEEPVATALPELLVTTVQVWRRFGLGRLFATGLALGLEHPERGGAFLSGMLEPFLQAMERRLEAHVARGDLPPIDVRMAAVQLLGPLVLVLLHQDSLQGAELRPLDVEDFARRHARLLLRGLSLPD